MTDSAIRSGVYSATATCAAPVFNPPEVISGPHPPANYTVNISTTTSGAQMRYTRNGTTPTATTGTLIAGTSGDVTIAANTVFTLKAMTFKSGYDDSSVTSGYFDNQNGGGNGPRHGEGGEEKSKVGGGSAKAEIESKERKLAQSAAASVKDEEEGTNLSRYHLNLWNSGALRDDPNLSLSWWGKKKQQGSQGGTNQMTSGSRSVIYTLDLMGNRTNVSEDGANKSYTVNSLNQYSTGDGLAVSNGASHEISAYNNTDYDYIGDSYLAKAAAGTNSYTLYYDALGRCVKRASVTNGGTAVTNYYLFDGEHWVVEYDTQNTIASNTIYGRGIDEIIARGIKDVGGYFYFPDRNGNISVVTDGTTMIRESYRYDAFGLPTIFDPDGSPTVPPTESEIGNKFMFTGREWDSAFGFYEYRARAYNPNLGRFMSEDPKGFDAGDFNLYRYCGNDPLDRVDPMGLDPGDPFDSSVEAVRDVHSFINPTSIRENTEYGSTIYKLNNKYYATTPRAGTAEHSYARDAAPEKAKTAGDYHTHGDYSYKDPNTGKITRAAAPGRALSGRKQDNMKSDEFSPKDKEFYQKQSKDKPEYKGYLGTPSGRAFEIDPKDPKQREIQIEMPARGN